MQWKYATEIFHLLSSPERHYVSCVACINSYLLTWRKKSMDKIRGRNTTYKFSWSSTTDTKILNIYSGIRYTFIEVFVFPTQHPKGSVIKRSITALPKETQFVGWEVPWGNFMDITPAVSRWRWTWQGRRHHAGLFDTRKCTPPKFRQVKTSKDKYRQV